MYQLCPGISLWHTAIPCTGMLAEYAIEFVFYSSPSVTTISPAAAHSQKNSYRCASRLDKNMEHGSGDASGRTGYATPLTNRDALSYGWLTPLQYTSRSDGHLLHKKVVE